MEPFLRQHLGLQLSDLYPVIKQVAQYFALPVDHTPADPEQILIKG